jgi:hypothetical protein
VFILQQQPANIVRAAMATATTTDDMQISMKSHSIEHVVTVVIASVIPPPTTARVAAVIRISTSTHFKLQKDWQVIELIRLPDADWVIFTITRATGSSSLTIDGSMDIAATVMGLALIGIIACCDGVPGNEKEPVSSIGRGGSEEIEGVIEFIIYPFIIC